MRYLIFFLFIFYISHLTGFAQVSSTLGRFEADFVQGCDPLTVTVTTAVPLADQPLWQFEGNTSTEEGPAQTLSHTYTTPGSYTIYLTVQNLDPRQDSLVVTVFESRTPVFEVFGCANNAVNVTIPDQYYDRFLIDYGDGTVIPAVKNQFINFHTYTNPGTYDITVTGIFDNAPNNCGSATQSYDASPTLIAPSVGQVQVSDSGSITLNYTLPQNLNYRLEVSLGSSQLFQLYSDLDNTSSSLQITDLDPLNAKYCFRITAIDNCTSDRTISNINCSVSLSGESQNNQNLVQWSNAEQGNEAYRISRNSTLSYLQLPSGNQSTIDQQVECGEEYCYSVTILYPDGSESSSNTICLNAFSSDTPPAVSDLSLAVLDEGVLAAWESDPLIDTAHIDQFSKDGIKIGQAETVQNQVILSVDINDFPQTCYTHTYVDGCGNTSEPLNNICTILLQGVSNPDGSISLFWTGYRGWSNGVANYQLQKFTESGSLIETIDVNLDTTFIDVIDANTSQILKFLILANPTDTQLGQSRSNTITIARKAQVHFPDAFSPNDDGLNDEFKPTHMFVNTYDLRIYNRWGELIFTSTDPDIGWDGRLSSGSAPNQTYTFHAVITDFRGLNITRSGIFLLVR